MRYLKLFESFESIKLSRTLGFLKSNKEKFIEELKSLASKKDFPISEYSDEMFQYLPFKKAFDFFWKPEPTICPTCKGEGRYRRPWGRGTRVVDCKECVDGKIQPVVGKASHIKFWFNSDGEYVGKTGIDGTITEKQSFTISGTKYVEDRTIDPNQLKLLPHESKIRIVIGWSWVLGVIWKSGTQTWVIQNSSTRGSGLHPANGIVVNEPRGEKWKKWGNRAYNLADYYTERGQYPKLLKERGTELDPYEFNYDVRFGYRGEISMYRGQDINPIIKDAEFALILDLNKIESDKKVSDIKLKRKEAKTGIYTPEEIKRQNVERYFDKLSQNFEISEDLGKISKIAPKIFGWSNCLIFIFNGTNISNFDNIINLYFNFMRGDKSEHQIDHLNRNLKYYFTDSMSYIRRGSPIISENIELLKKELKITGNVIGIQFLEELVTTSRLINQRILNSGAENLSDLEMIMQKINSISNILSSSRYELSNFRYLISRMGQTSSENLYADLSYKSTENFQNGIDDLKTIQGLINRM